MGDLGFSFQQLFQLIKDAGSPMALVFAFLWWLERQERLDDRKINEERAQRRDVALNEVRLALAALTAIFSSRGRR